MEDITIIGYVPVCAIGQSLEVQIDKLTDHGCEEIYKEKLSGTTATRPQLEACLDYVRDGDLIVVTKPGRLARSTLDLHRIVHDLNEKSARFRALDQSFNTTTKEVQLMFTTSTV